MLRIGVAKRLKPPVPAGKGGNPAGGFNSPFGKELLDFQDFIPVYHVTAAVCFQINLVATYMFLQESDLFRQQFPVGAFLHIHNSKIYGGGKIPVIIFHPFYTSLSWNLLNRAEKWPAARRLLQDIN